MPHWPKRLTRFSPPRKWGKEPALGCRWFTAWPKSWRRAGFEKPKGTRYDRRAVVSSSEKSPVATTVNEVSARTATISRKLTILVVDDDPLVLTNMAAMLEDLGHTVHEASSALEALSILGRESAIELVLTDQAMPQMTGAELIAEIKSRWPKLPVILATGFAELPPGIDPSADHARQTVPAIRFGSIREAALEDPKKRRVVRFRERS